MNKTNQKVFLIGHSQGTTCYFVMAAERPEYNDKVKISANYAPSIFLKYMDYPIAVTFSYLVDVYQVVNLKIFTKYLYCTPQLLIFKKFLMNKFKSVNFLT